MVIKINKNNDTLNLSGCIVHRKYKNGQCLFFRRIHGATAMALNQKRNEPILLQDCKASYSEAAMGVKNGEIFTENRER